MRCLLLVLGLFTNPILAATFVVSNTNDSGPGSLREAISLSASNLEEDTIIFDPIIFFAPQTIVLQSGELLVSPDPDLSKGVHYGLSIIGPGPEKLTIDGDRKSRIFHSESGSFKFSISGMTLIRGYAVRGGAIYARNSLKVSNSVIRDNLAAGYAAEWFDPPGGAGGGIYADGFVISDSVISGNVASGILLTSLSFPYGPIGTSGRGGGIYGSGFMINCSLVDNTARGEHGQNVNSGFAGSGGDAYGGAAFSPSELYVINSRFWKNSAAAGNGANVLDGTAGKGGEASGGAIYVSGGRIANSSFVENSSIGGYGGSAPNALLSGNGGASRGGAIFEKSLGRMANITVVKNIVSAGDGRNGGHASGGGINTLNASPNMVHATISDNLVEAGDGTQNSGSSRGGGFYTEFDDVTSLTFKNNIVAANAAGEGPDLFGHFPASFNNLIGIGAGTTALANGINGNLVGSLTLPLDARLASLASDEGMTETRPPLPDSPAIDAGNNSVSDPWFHSAGVRPLLYDQRGLARIYPAGGQADIGAYESGANNLVSVSTPDLRDQSDSGNSNGDNITNFGSVSFDVTNAVPGARIELLRDEVVVAALNYIQVATNSNVNTLTDPSPPLDGAVHYRAQQVLAGRTSQASYALPVRFDSTPPTGTINQAATQADPTTQSTIHFTAVFNEPVESPGKLSFAGSTANITNPPLIITTSDQITIGIGVWGFNSDGGTVTASLGVFKDLAGNIGTPLSSTDNSITVDNMRPRVTLNQAAGQTDPTISQPLLYDVIFSEPVSGFTGSDILLMSSTPNLSSAIVKVEGSGTIYRVSVSNLTPSGFLRAWVVSGAVQDSFGNSNFQSTFVDNSITLGLPASLSGQVVDTGDRGVRGAIVSITDSQNVTASVVTSSLGFYSFSNIAPGTYTIRINSRRFRFESRQIAVSGDISNENFKGLE